VEKPQKVVIYGPEGIGKSSLAAMFPKGIFLDIEGSTYQLDVAREEVSSWTMLLERVKKYKGDQEFDTLIVDTADWAEELCKSHICSTNNKTGIEDFGYHKGFTYLAEEFGRFLNLLSDLIGTGLNVVVVAHAEISKFDLPEEAGSYNRWVLKLEKETAPLLKEWADMVLFINYKTFVVKSDNKMEKGKAQGGKRVIYTQHHVCWDAKNRRGLPEELSFNSPEDGWKQIAHCIPERPTKEVKPVSQQATTKQNEPEAKELDEFKPGESANQVANETTEPKDPDKPKDDLYGVPKALADLMRENNVTAEEIQKACSQKGYFPVDTPLSNYPTDFINGWLIGLWPQVFSVIRENRK
jgi:hypothetical protein